MVIPELNVSYRQICSANNAQLANGTVAFPVEQMARSGYLLLVRIRRITDMKIIGLAVDPKYFEGKKEQKFKPIIFGVDKETRCPYIGKPDNLQYKVTNNSAEIVHKGMSEFRIEKDQIWLLQAPTDQKRVISSFRNVNGNGAAVVYRFGREPYPIEDLCIWEILFT